MTQDDHTNASACGACRPAVVRAFLGMVEQGTPRGAALAVACRVFRYHHPLIPAERAQATVTGWLAGWVGAAAGCNAPH